MNKIDYIKFIPKLLFKGNCLPIYLVMFITSDCTLSCGHCLLGKGLIKDKYQLSIDDIEKLSKSLGKLLFFLPTGGEPFLREDITEIVKIFRKNNKVCNIGIPTNGTLTETIVSRTRKMLAENPDVDLAVDVSIDGIGEEHNEIRNGPECFEKAVWTFRELKKLEGPYPNFNANIGLTISSYNINRLYDLYYYIHNELGATTINHLLVRGEPRNDTAKKVDIDKYLEFSIFLENEVKKGKLKGYKGFPFADTINSIRTLRPHIILERVKTGMQRVPCLAARLGAVILSDGMLMPCEILDKPIGNLRDTDFDFKRLWYTDTRKKLMSHIMNNHCCCTYECFLTLSIFFTFKGLSRLLLQSKPKLNAFAKRQNIGTAQQKAPKARRANTDE